ncbi:hypothetical protein [Myroides odoratus]|uniref:hypothetical protein n=1 Tax=Myroides odoratus TaxID=256 RepID=UPI0039AF913E
MIGKKKNRAIVRIGIFISVFLVFCCKKSDIHKNDLYRTIEKIIEVSKEDGYSDFMDLYLFKKGNTADELVHFDIDELRRLYFGKHITNITDNLTFDEFLREIIENRVNLECDILGECFLIDESINKEYKLLGFSKFKEKYTSNIFANGIISLNINNLEREKTLSIIYFFYLNNYFTDWADYEGSYFSKKLLDTDIFQRPKEVIELEEL